MLYQLSYFRKNAPYPNTLPATTKTRIAGLLSSNRES